MSGCDMNTATAAATASSVEPNPYNHQPPTVRNGDKVSVPVWFYIRRSISFTLKVD